MITVHIIYSYMHLIVVSDKLHFGFKKNNTCCKSNITKRLLLRDLCMLVLMGWSKGNLTLKVLIMTIDARGHFKTG